MENRGGHYLRELLEMLKKDLFVLEKTEASCCGMTLSQCHVILAIGKAGEVSLNELAGLLNLDSSTISRSVDNLFNKGLVSRKVDERDRRYVRISLTEMGKEVYGEIERNLADYFERVFSSIPEEKRHQVLESLKLLLDAVRENRCCEEGFLW
ncbi:putative HTH-type transcriptional regulator YusO [Fervidicola ferrireducens]|uniref:Putative HTH-type transcriptional regulator YusO n=1 Tax=Fervidicola ferrireducens TaxID=520764 RepID=A0A140LCW6_9FIRM|nr:MarR family transcriptional regulator [Fervidicola ferrireducens]KXG78391.1 putative HTH-type transcriptional regulator YusO [Fervidicola ferrireducens]